MAENLSKEQAIIITGFTGIVACNFSYFHEDCEKRLGRSIWTHQFSNKDLWKEIKEAYRADFIAICPMEKS